MRIFKQCPNGTEDNGYKHVWRRKVVKDEATGKRQHFHYCENCGKHK